MARLSLSCLGPFQVTLDGQPVTSFKSNKVRALLAYLAVEAARPHPREVLAGLLWPDWPDRDARSNLRYALSNLRRAIGDRARAKGRDADPPFLLITRDTLQFNAASDHWLDVAAFTRLTGLRDLSGVEEAIALYRGSFLEGFSLADSPAFEEWALLTRERVARQMSSALHRLAESHEQRGQYEQAQSFARRQLELEPWDEVAHQQLMRALALNGQRSAALAHYEACCRSLAEELGVQPAEETTTLYEQIRDDKLKVPRPPLARPPVAVAEPPPFLSNEESAQVERPFFVAREPELAQLHQFLDLALAGQGRVVFVTGDGGSGKTTLVHEFSRRAREAHADLIVASGNCNAYTGIGDPYLPFREILELLTGDVEARWAAGAISREHARRLWNTLPLAAQALVEMGPDLIDTFVLRAALLERATAYASGRRVDWLTRLDEIVESRPPGLSMTGPQQSDLFEQYTKVLQALARQLPLVLVLDDLQWADLGSISLLFHLGRHLAGSRILIVGAYRSEEVTIGRDEKRHPLEPVVNEFRRDFGDITVNLGQAGNRDFVEAFLDSPASALAPNRLGDAFREMLYRQTRGHPLFTIELLRGLQERGDLAKDQEGCWAEGPALDWETLPARVEAVIAERMNRLAQPLQATLRVASVEGEQFTAEVVAQVQEADEREMVGRLSNELDRKHRLVRAQAIERLGARRVSRYRFRNYLFQKYVYDNLDPVQRAYLHEDVGNVLEQFYGDQASEIAAIAPQLSWHFQEAGIAEKAICYLVKAGERAVQLSAYQQGIAHLTKGLELLVALPDSPERNQQELALQLALGLAWRGPKGTQASEFEQAYTRARELCQQMGKTSQLSRIVGELSMMHYVRAEHQRAHTLADEALSLAQQETSDPLLVGLAHWHLGVVLFSLGEYTAARTHLDQVITFYNPEQHHRSFVYLRGSDAGPSALAYDACCLWCLGYPEQALKHSQEALALARELDHPFTLADVLSYAGCMFSEMRRDGLALKDHAEELLRLASERTLVWSPEGQSYRGGALAMLGQVDEGIAQMHEGIAAIQSSGTWCALSEALCNLAKAQAQAGQPEEGLATLAEALAFVEQTEQRQWEAELHRLRAELLLMQGQDAGAEASLHKAVEVARWQRARSWELRATKSLARLWQKQDRTLEARRLLADIYGWFTEGFDTRDLKEARGLLNELG
jgi:DNA-binding SARP family transcriptional activator/predicted ATPase